MRHAISRSRLLTWLGWIPIIICYKDYVVMPNIVTGRSMQPTLNPNSSAWRDIGIFDRSVSSRNYNFQRGDIITAKSPLNPEELLIKRIVAVAGDTVQTLSPYPDKQVIIPEGHIWIEGDESFRTIDSNTFGPLPMGLVHSRLLFILWPFKRFGMPPVRRPEWLRSRISTSPARVMTG